MQTTHGTADVSELLDMELISQSVKEEIQSFRAEIIQRLYIIMEDLKRNQAETPAV